MTTTVTTETADMPDELPGEAEPTLQGLLGQLAGSGGWADLDAGNLGKLLQKQMQLQRAAMRKEAMAFRECFATEAGKKVLQILLDMTLRRTAWPLHAMTDANMLQAYGLSREAENSFMAGIIEAIAFANNATLQPRSQA